MGRLPNSAKIDASVNNIPTAFSSGAGSRILTSLANAGYTHIGVINETSSRIRVATSIASTIPASNTTAMFFVPANFVIWLDDFSVSESIFIQSDSGGTISVGTVEVMLW